MLESYHSQAAVPVEAHAIDESGLGHINPRTGAAGVCHLAIIKRPAASQTMAGAVCDA